MSELSPKIDLEMVDIVDDNGNILYPILKTEAHKQGLLHKTVIAGVFNSRGDIMVVEQASDRQEPGKYVNPVGGHVSSGETEDEALRREAFEELGITNFETKIVGRATFNRPILGRIENHLFVLYEIITDESPSLGVEAVSFKWFSRNEYKDSLTNTPDIFGTSHHFVLNQFYPDLFK